jgi:hypothetical protein
MNNNAHDEGLVNAPCVNEIPVNKLEKVARLTNDVLHVLPEKVQEVLDLAGIDYADWGTEVKPKSKSVQRLIDEVAQNECVISILPVEELKNQEWRFPVELPESGFVAVREIVPVVSNDIYAKNEGKFYRMVEAGQIRFVKASDGTVQLIARQRDYLRGAVSEKPTGVESQNILSDVTNLTPAIMRSLDEELPSLKLGSENININPPQIIHEPMDLGGDTYPGLPTRVTVYNSQLLLNQEVHVDEPIFTYEEKDGVPDKVTVFVFMEVADPAAVYGQKVCDTFGTQQMAEAFKQVESYTLTQPRNPLTL